MGVTGEPLWADPLEMRPSLMGISQNMPLLRPSAWGVGRAVPTQTFPRVDLGSGLLCGGAARPEPTSASTAAKQVCGRVVWHPQGHPRALVTSPLVLSYEMSLTKRWGLRRPLVTQGRLFVGAPGVLEAL